MDPWGPYQSPWNLRASSGALLEIQTHQTPETAMKAFRPRLGSTHPEESRGTFLGVPKDL